MFNFSLVDKVENITKKEFKERCLSTNAPVIFKDLTKNWKATTKWTFDFLKKNAEIGKFLCVMILIITQGVVI